MKSFFATADRQAIIDRLHRLESDAPRRWGSMSAPEMVTHLIDQMTICLGDETAAPIQSVYRWPGIRFMALYVMPWPRGRIQGPPEAFVTKPASFPEDVSRLIGLVERFGRSDAQAAWPDHALFGRMSGKDWGFFCYKHFDFHLQQFGS